MLAWPFQPIYRGDDKWDRVFLLPPSAFKIWWYHYACEEGQRRESWPGTKTLCKKLGLNKDTLANHRRWLVENKWLVKVRETRTDGEFGVPVYRCEVGTVPEKIRDGRRKNRIRKNRMPSDPKSSASDGIRNLRIRIRDTNTTPESETVESVQSVPSSPVGQSSTLFEDSQTLLVEQEPENHPELEPLEKEALWDGGPFFALMEHLGKINDPEDSLKLADLMDDPEFNITLLWLFAKSNKWLERIQTWNDFFKKWRFVKNSYHRWMSKAQESELFDPVEQVDYLTSVLKKKQSAKECKPNDHKSTAANCLKNAVNNPSGEKDEEVSKGFDIEEDAV